MTTLYAKLKYAILGFALCSAYVGRTLFKKLLPTRRLRNEHPDGGSGSHFEKPGFAEAQRAKGI